MRKIPLILSFVFVLSGNRLAAEPTLIFQDDFSEGAGAWLPTDERAWKITEVDGNPAYEILGGSKYKPPHRSPENIAIR